MTACRWANHVAPCSFRFLGQLWMSNTSLKDRYTRKFKLSGREEEPALRSESSSIVWKYLCFSAADINQEIICKECCRSAPQSNLTYSNAWKHSVNCSIINAWRSRKTMQWLLTGIIQHQLKEPQLMSVFFQLTKMHWNHQPVAFSLVKIQ